MTSTGGCPFGGRSPTQGARPLQEANRDATVSGPKPLPTGRARVVLLYEEYVHLPLLREVWEQPSTERPVLEPLFAAGFQGIELCLLLLAEFISDRRGYVAKRPRVELVAEDIATQCRLLTEVVDAELEEELEGDQSLPDSRLTLTQPFPFEGCPPTKAGPCHSPGLRRLADAIAASLPRMSAAERNSVVKLVLNLTAAFASFQRWTVGLGIEHQLQALQAAVGLQPTQYRHTLNLDYDSLVQPWRCENTLTCETYTHAEDWFFRTVHLGTDCWAFVALARLTSAHELAASGRWHVAASRAMQAARMLDYLGSHMLLLTSMNLRDYYLLKPELEGTSGEGSQQVKSLRRVVAQLLEPLAAALLGSGAGGAAGTQPAAGEAAAAPGAAASEQDGDDGAALGPLGRALLALYESPDRPGSSGLYNYSRALEVLESGLLGGFYFKHYCLATNVIGSEARGTMKRAVQALKAGYETPVFPLLDAVRCALGKKIDAQAGAVRKGRVMEEILRRYREGHAGQAVPPQVLAAAERHASMATGSGCPFGHGGAAELDSARASAGAAGLSASPPDAAFSGFEAARRQLYSWQGVPPEFSAAVRAETARQAEQLALVPHASTSGGGSSSSGGAGQPLAFLDHAWGQVAPLAQYRAWLEGAALQQLGNPCWDALFGRVMPEAASNIRQLLGLPSGDAATTVHFGSNSHELVCRLLSCCLEWSAGSASSRGVGGAGSSQPLRLLCSDTEFYSVTRQANRMMEAGLVELEAVPAEPADDFTERCCAAVAAAAAAGCPFDAMYVSQTTYLGQRTLVPQLPALVRGVHAAARGAAAAAGGGEDGPLVIMDAYHGFMALPTDLGSLAEAGSGRWCYVAGLLKHAGCGANCAFAVLPANLAAVARPLLTGWLADPSVLGHASAGIQLGTQVGYCPELALQGGTPSYMQPLLTFNHLMQLWRGSQPGVAVEDVHAHVLALHARFLDGLDAAGHPAVNPSTLLPPQDPACRSHTLVFRLADAASAAKAVAGLAARGVLVDTRRAHVRLGFGPNHGPADVDALLAALAADAAASRTAM